MRGTLAASLRGGKTARSMTRSMSWIDRAAAVLTAAVAAAMLVLAGPAAAAGGGLSEPDLQIYRQAFKAAEKDRWDEARRLASQAGEKLPGKVVEWLILSRPGNGTTFDDIAGFIKRNPSWPNIPALRRQAEASMPTSVDDEAARAWFKAYPPLTNTGFMRYAEALLAVGETAKVTAMVRQRWVDAAFTASEEPEFRGRFGTLLRAQDHVARFDRLLWDHQDAPARRLLPLLDPGHAALAEARLLLADDAPGAEGAINRVPEDLRRDPGLLYERLRWRRKKDNYDGAMEILKNPPAQLGRPALWWTERHIMARRAIERGDHKLAYRLVKAHGQKEGTALYEAEFLAGFLALRFLDNPSSGFEHFHRLYLSSTAPISRARGAYWCGRAADAVGDKDGARQWFETATAFGTTFYGQLASARLGRPAKVPPSTEPSVTKDTTAEFNRKELVRVVNMLTQIDRNGLADHITVFLRRIGSDADRPADYALATRLALDTGRPDIAINIAKQASQNNVLLVEGGYPVIKLNGTTTPEAALVHSLIRQESTFNQNAVSPAGARGLMQLMPATAQHVASKLGIPKHNHAQLTSDPEYNVRLGSAFIAELIDRYNGSYVLATAAYNAGPGRVSGWINTYGDPRAEGAEMVDWIELIPISETRNYVQRVLENVQVYRSRLNDGKAGRSLEQDLKR